MKEFDYVIIGGGCAGLSLAYELEINEKLKKETLAARKIARHSEGKSEESGNFLALITHSGHSVTLSVGMSASLK